MPISLQALINSVFRADTCACFLMFKHKRTNLLAWQSKAASDSWGWNASKNITGRERSFGLIEVDSNCSEADGHEGPSSWSHWSPRPVLLRPILCASSTSRMPLQNIGLKELWDRLLFQQFGVGLQGNFLSCRPRCVSVNHVLILMLINMHIHCLWKTCSPS